jgi:hypothetical protein|tara:strand:+ start:4207 stop:4587 length:381 start_codon:yes stop_codon:yes gene_type:complete
MIDIDLRTHLLADTAISSTVAGVYALRLPQDTTSSAIVYEIGAGHSAPQIGSMETVIRHTVTLFAYSPSYQTLRVLSENITNLLNGMTGPMGSTSVTGSQIDSSINTYEEELQLYRNIINLTIYTN